MIELQNSKRETTKIEKLIIKIEGMKNGVLHAGKEVQLSLPTQVQQPVGKYRNRNGVWKLSSLACTAHIFQREYGTEVIPNASPIH